MGLVKISDSCFKVLCLWFLFYKFKPSSLFSMMTDSAFADDQFRVVGTSDNSGFKYKSEVSAPRSGLI